MVGPRRRSGGPSEVTTAISGSACSGQELASSPGGRARLAGPKETSTLLRTIKMDVSQTGGSRCGAERRFVGSWFVKQAAWQCEALFFYGLVGTSACCFPSTAKPLPRRIDCQYCKGSPTCMEPDTRFLEKAPDLPAPSFPLTPSSLQAPLPKA